MRSLLVVSLALLPPLVTSLWMRVQLGRVEQDTEPWPGFERLPLDP